jgi:short subunit dehydrogenase-like uncharacterized protein
LEIRVASIDDAASLDQAIAGAAAVINCSGPFLDTATPVVEAALRARIHYLDVTAEQPVVLETFKRFADLAQDAGICRRSGSGFLRRIGRPACDSSDG